MNTNLILDSISSEIEILKQRQRGNKSIIKKLQTTIWNKRFDYHERTKEEQVVYLRDVITPLEGELGRLCAFDTQISHNYRDLQTAHKVILKYGLVNYEGGNK